MRCAVPGRQLARHGLRRAAVVGGPPWGRGSGGVVPARGPGMDALLRTPGDPADRVLLTRREAQGGGGWARAGDPPRAHTRRRTHARTHANARTHKRTLFVHRFELLQEMHCSALIERVDTRAHGLLYALRPDQTRQMEDFEAHTKQQKGVSSAVCREYLSASLLIVPTRWVFRGWCHCCLISAK